MSFTSSSLLLHDKPFSGAEYAAAGSGYGGGGGGERYTQRRPSWSPSPGSSWMGQQQVRFCHYRFFALPAS
jgi:hypothetical protein